MKHLNLIIHFSMLLVLPAINSPIVFASQACPDLTGNYEVMELHQGGENVQIDPGTYILVIKQKGCETVSVSSPDPKDPQPDENMGFAAEFRTNDKMQMRSKDDTGIQWWSKSRFLDHGLESLLFAGENSQKLMKVGKTTMILDANFKDIIVETFSLETAGSQWHLASSMRAKRRQ